METKTTLCTVGETETVCVVFFNHTDLPVHRLRQGHGVGARVGSGAKFGVVNVVG